MVSESISRVVVLLSELVGILNVLHNICLHFELSATEVTLPLLPSIVTLDCNTSPVVLAVSQDVVWRYPHIQQHN